MVDVLSPGAAPEDRALSIFSKTCPECAAVNPAGATNCACGYSFDVDGTNGSRNTLELVAQEERLYLDYLAARVKQAAEAAKIAHKLANADPENHTKAADALRADQLLMTARGELSEQEARLRVATLRLEHVKAFVRPLPSRSPTKKPAAGAKAVAPQFSLTTPKKRATHRPGATVHKTAAPATPAVSPAPRAETRARFAPPAAPAAPKTKSPEKAPAQPAKARTEVAASATQAAVKPAAPRTAVPTAKPGPIFRAAQAARAEKAMESQGGHRATAPPATPPKVATPAKRPAAPVADSQPKPVAASAPATKECPHCWGAVPISANRCRCGYEFSTGPELPGLTLSASERALFSSLDFTGATKPR
jgi:Uncharacterised protein family UPF0547